MSKKYLRKNEFRIYNNPNNKADKQNGHPTYITARYNHAYKGNTVTHSRYAKDIKCLTMNENPNKNRHDFRTSRVSAPEWKNEKYFGERLSNWRWSNSNIKKIKKFNKNFYK